MMTMRGREEQITDILVSLRGIEEHLKQMNGRLLKHDDQLFVECPTRHNGLNEQISQLRVELAKLKTQIMVYVPLVNVVIAAAILATLQLK